MSLYIKIDFPASGEPQLYAWTSSNPNWSGKTSNICATSVPKLLRKLARKLEGKDQ